MSSDASPDSPLFPREVLHPAALAWGDAHARDDSPWCVAFSGGADSLALLVVLRGLYPQRKIVALHFNHHLRGEASDGDEQFCRDTCAAFGIEFRGGHWRHANADVSEADARAARHAFFDEQMSALGARALWLGHQLDDIAETQLMRLARGSSTAGLAAPRPVHVRADGRVFLRPLLTLSKNEITAALRARGFAWREDATNFEGDFFRNRIRRDVIPAFIAASENNNARAGAALTRELLDEDAAALDAWLDALLPSDAVTPDALDLRSLAGKPRALFRRALRRWPPAAGLARSGFEALLDICQNNSNGARTSVGDATAIFENGILRLAGRSSSASSNAHASDASPPSFSQPFALPQDAQDDRPLTLSLPDGATLTASLVTLTPALRDEIFGGRYDPTDTVFVSAPAAQNHLFVRSLCPGDRCHPLGAPGSAKVSDLLINRKIPREHRLTLPAVCVACDARSDAGEILWIPGLPPADAWKITSKTQQALHLTYRRGTCTVHPKSLLNS